MEELLKPDDVAKILQISKAKAYTLLKEGGIPTIRIGGLVRVRREDLEQYIHELARKHISGEASDSKGSSPESQ